MDRRGFLARLMAVSAAMAVKALPAAAGSTTRRLTGEQQMLIDLLGDCRIVSAERHDSLHGPSEYVIRYRRDDGVGLNDIIVPFCKYTHREILEKGYPKSMSYSMTANIRSQHLGDTEFRVKEPVMEIEVVWYLPC